MARWIGLLRVCLLVVFSAFNCLKLSEGIQCQNCFYISTHGLTVGDPGCSNGNSSFLTECSENTIIPSSIFLDPNSVPSSIGDLRRRLSTSNPNLTVSKTVYACGLAKVRGVVEGASLSLVTRSCTFRSKGKSSKSSGGCKSGSSKDFGEEEDRIMMQFKPDHDDDDDDFTDVQQCVCFEDKCYPEEQSSSKTSSDSSSNLIPLNLLVGIIFCLSYSFKKCLV